jgi:hypothetical protein
MRSDIAGAFGGEGQAKNKKPRESYAALFGFKWCQRKGSTLGLLAENLPDMALTTAELRHLTASSGNDVDFDVECHRRVMSHQRSGAAANNHPS